MSNISNPLQDLKGEDEEDRRSFTTVDTDGTDEEEIPHERLAVFTTVQTSIHIEKTKHLEELGLYFIGQYLYESDFQISLEDYLRGEFLLNAITAGKEISVLPPGNRRNISLCIYFILKFGQRFDSPEKKQKEELIQIFSFKTKGWSSVHITERAHGSRKPVWMLRYSNWLSIRIVGENYETNRGIRYSSYTKGYHDGKTLRPYSPSDDQILDRDAYTVQSPTLLITEIWDPDEYRQEL
jgi:hypothetical protein